MFDPTTRDRLVALLDGAHWKISYAQGIVEHKRDGETLAEDLFQLSLELDRIRYAIDPLCVEHRTHLQPKERAQLRLDSGRVS